MKTSIKLFAFGMILMGFGVNANAQVTASATSTATIVTPIGITNAGDMNFGNIAVSSAAGTVTLEPAGTRTYTGGITLPNVNGTVSTAKFNVTGEGTYTYAITLPTSALTLSYSGNTMTVTGFTSNPSGTGALTAGKQTINVGATLNVGASQVAGTYISGTPFDVTVNYN